MFRALDVRVLLVVVGIAILTGFATPVAAASCGGEGERPCAYARAVNKGKPQLRCARGSFLDPRNGGECWACPKGYKRTLTPVTAKNACVRPAYTAYKKAKRHGRGTGVLKTNCKKGQFYDIGKKYCYSCPKRYKRTAHSVTSSKACSRRIGKKAGVAKLESKAACPPGAFFDLIDGGSCWACPKGYDRSLASVKAHNACAKPLTEQAVAALKGKTVYCQKGLVEFGGKCVKKGDCGKAGKRACLVTERVPSCDKGLVEISGQCLKSGACGKKGQRPCLIIERIPSCDKGLAEDFLKNKCDKPQPFAKVCTEIMTALQKKRSIPVLDRLQAEKDRFIKSVSDKSGATKIINDANDAIAKIVRRPDIAPYQEELADLTKFVHDKSEQITKSLLAPKPFCSDTPAQRLAKIKKLDLIPKFRALKKAGLFDGFLISSAHAAANPNFYYWSINLSFSATQKLKKVTINAEVIFETDLRNKKDRVVAVNHTTSANLEASEDKTEWDFAYAFYINKKASDFGTLSPGVAVGASIGLRNLVKLLKKVSGSEALRLLLDHETNVSRLMDRFSFGVTFPIKIGAPMFSVVDNVGISVNLRTTPNRVASANAPLPTVSLGLGNTYPVR